MAERRLPQGFRRKPNGQLEYRFSIGPERFSVSGATVKECREKETAKRAAAASGYILNSKVTIRDYFTEYMENKAGTVKPVTIRVQKTAFAPVLDLIGAVRVRDLERRQVIALQKALREKLTTAGVNTRLSLLSSLMRSAVADRIRPDNPCDGVKTLRRTEPQARECSHRALTPEEQAAFFRAAAGLPPEGEERQKYQRGKAWLYELLCFLIMTGCRAGEARALKWSDIDTKKGVVHIRRTITETEDGIAIGTSTKTKSSTRDIPLTDGIREILRQQRQKCLDVVGAVPVDGLIFISANTHGLIHEGALTKGMNAICRRAGIERISAHALRHTFATRAIEQGMNPQTLKTILGHTTLAMTMDLYAHVLPDTKAAEMNSLSIAI